MDSSEIYKLIAQKASFPAILPSMSSGCGLLILRCIKQIGVYSCCRLDWKDQPSTLVEIKFWF